MIKRIVALVVFITFLPILAHAGPKIEFKKAEDVQKDFDQKHKKDIKKEMKSAKNSYDIDLSQNQFSSDTRVGLTNMTGNTSSLAVNGTTETEYRHKRWANRWDAGAFYSRVFSSNSNTAIGTSARYIYGSYRLDYYILRRLTVFGGGGGYSNELKGIDLGGQGFTGVMYYFLMEPTYYFSGSLGYNFTYEDIVSPQKNRKIHSAALILDYEQQLRDNLKLEQRVEVLQDIQNGREIRVNSGTSLRVSISKHIGVALGFIVLFDNDPPVGFKKLDTITNFSLAVVF
ncbi:MAG: DUF481 domain-containing protein [Deltaproteobacteria bacterium]|mgnify:CR=1 FL=1|jgi:putative salt-induced outer membrane protein YdiY|nr:DUF481 domain-containing protein [Deltaproteobacteria bacterium]